VDLASLEHQLAIEVDGHTHKQRKWRFLDARKTAVLNALGWRVIRFWNEQVLADLDAVVSEIRRQMSTCSSSDSLPLLDLSQPPTGSTSLTE
ncbi:endonuclease domain-containing protein, partial [Teichococcus vastitatis]|uniref:endonuclease domain-containing protein n=1 Tax=Teichococcus vastitatis TaxID=2307076 RepID=UPI000E707BFF